MAERNIKVAMFDLGNVIICFDHMIAARKIAEYSNRKLEEIYNLFFSSELTEKFDTGQLNKREFFIHVSEILNLSGLCQEEFYNIWNSIFWENPGISKVIEDVKKKYGRFFIISNVNKVHFEYIWEKFPVVRMADEAILSYRVGFLKPDFRIYQIAIEKAGCRPAQIFYTDDREELVAEAKKIGFNAQIFRGISSLKDLV